MPLDKFDQQHLRAAHGYIQLGMFEEANAELEEIDPFCRHLPEVLSARVVIYHALKKWELRAVVAEKLVAWNPNEVGYFIDLAYAKRRAEIEEIQRRLGCDRGARRRACIRHQHSKGRRHQLCPRAIRRCFR
jgi:hypothetical protein